MPMNQMPDDWPYAHRGNDAITGIIAAITGANESRDRLRAEMIRRQLGAGTSPDLLADVERDTQPVLHRLFGVDQKPVFPRDKAGAIQAYDPAALEGEQLMRVLSASQGGGGAAAEPGGSIASRLFSEETPLARARGGMTTAPSGSPVEIEPSPATAAKIAPRETPRRRSLASLALGGGLEPADASFVMRNQALLKSLGRDEGETNLARIQRMRDLEETGYSREEALAVAFADDLTGADLAKNLGRQDTATAMAARTKATEEAKEPYRKNARAHARELEDYRQGNRRELVGARERSSKAVADHNAKLGEKKGTSAKATSSSSVLNALSNEERVVRGALEETRDPAEREDLQARLAEIQTERRQAKTKGGIGSRMIKVKVKGTNTTGTVSEAEFDESLFERAE